MICLIRVELRVQWPPVNREDNRDKMEMDVRGRDLLLSTLSGISWPHIQNMALPRHRCCFTAVLFTVLCVINPASMVSLDSATGRSAFHSVDRAVTRFTCSGKENPVNTPHPVRTDLPFLSTHIETGWLWGAKPVGTTLLSSSTRIDLVQILTSVHVFTLAFPVKY